MEIAAQPKKSQQAIKQVGSFIVVYCFSKLPKTNKTT